MKRLTKQRYILGLLLVSLVFVLAISALSPVQAQSVGRVGFEGQGRPRSNSSGGTRTQFCGQSISGAPMTALLPQTGIALTATAHPTLLIYLPSTSAEQVFLKLEDERGQDLYQTILPIEQTPGIVGVTLSDAVPDLVSGQRYKWTLAVICNQVLDPNDPLLSGWIERVEIELPARSQAGAASSLQLAKLYEEQGLWLDALATLTALRRELAELEADRSMNPEMTQIRDQARAQWNALLAAEGLQAIAAQSWNE